MAGTSVVPVALRGEGVVLSGLYLVGFLFIAALVLNLTRRSRRCEDANRARERIAVTVTGDC